MIIATSLEMIALKRSNTQEQNGAVFGFFIRALTALRVVVLFIIWGRVEVSEEFFKFWNGKSTVIGMGYNQLLRRQRILWK